MSTGLWDLCGHSSLLSSLPILGSMMGMWCGMDGTVTGVQTTVISPRATLAAS